MATGSLAIRVWEDGSHRPVAGATVEIGNASGGLPGGATDAAGVLELPELPEGWVGAVVTAPGFAPSEPDFATVADGLVATLQFAMQRSVAVEGVVVAKDGGAPVAGATVAAIRGRVLVRGGGALAECRTDAAGRFRFAAVPRTERTSDAPVVVVSHEAFATVDVVVRPAPSDAGPIHVRVEMNAGATLGGVVLDAEGRPRAGAVVEAHTGLRAGSVLRFGGGPSWSTSSSGAASIHRPRTTESAPDGAFALTGLKRGAEHTILARARDCAPSDPVKVRADETAPPVELRLRSPGRLVVRVVDASGRPVADAIVSVSGEMQAFEGVPDGAGVWRYDVAAAVVFVFVEAPGLVRNGRSVTLREGRTTAARVAMKPAHHVAGVVVDDAGSPIAGANVCANDRDPISDDSHLRGAPFTDADGRYRLEGLPAKAHRIVAETPGRERGEVGGVRPPADGVRIVVPRGVTVRSRFEPPAGEPAPREVHFAHPARTVGARRTDATAECFRRESALADDGVVEITGVPAGGVALRLLVTGFQRIERRIDARPGEIVDLGAVVLERALDLTGRVVGEDGAPLAGACVSVSDDSANYGDNRSPWVIRATTASDGTFRLCGLSRGSVKLAVPSAAIWLPPSSFEVDVGSGEPVTLTIPRDDKEALRARLLDATHSARSKRRRGPRRR